MRKIILSTIAAATIVVASNTEYKYEITPMIGGAIPFGQVELENHLTYGGTAWFNTNKEIIFDHIELGWLETNGAEYSKGSLETDISRIFVNGIKEYKMNNSFKLYALAGLGHEFLSRNLYENDDNMFANYGFGAKYSINDYLSLKADIRHLIKFDGDNSLLYTAGLGFSFGKIIRDIDGDGIIDLKDKCGNTPSGIVVNSNGCEIDSDSDGIANSSDSCPNTSIGADVDSNGCEMDSDLDGILNSKDSCPNTNNGVSVDNIGCELDSDSDGVVDSKDNCLNTYSNTPVDFKGCELDSDFDGVVNSQDNCINTQSGVEVDESGCAAITIPKGLIIHFATNKADTNNFDTAKFIEYIKYLSKNPTAKLVLKGHTDSIGSAAKNITISHNRVLFVKSQLIKAGLDGDRIQTEAYGETKPLVNNKTKENRALNRRVEFTIAKSN